MICTKSELEFYFDNEAMILRQRQKEMQREQRMVCDSDTRELCHKVPVPNQNHPYCGVCRTKYEGYFEHLESKDH